MISKKRFKFWMELGSHRRLVCHWAVIALASLAMAGCPAPTLKEDPKIKTLTSGLDTINTQ